MARLRVPALLVLAALVLGGCGDDDPMPSAPAVVPEPGGTLEVAVEDQIGTLDPLFASTRAERMAARQIYEPLQSVQQGPFGATRRRNGIARSLRPSAEGTIWTARLRRGVDFSNGEPLDADAVLVNADRWIASPAGQERIPELRAVDSPRPGRVRFLLDSPVERFSRSLADPRFGLVAPSPLLGVETGSLRLDAAGTGPFEFRGQDGGATLLARNAEWWGTPAGLGPGVDQISLTTIEDGSDRLAALIDGGEEVADQLGSSARERIAADPLLTEVKGRQAAIGLERSVRGLDSAAAAQSLADVWLTDLR